MMVVGNDGAVDAIVAIAKTADTVDDATNNTKIENPNGQYVFFLKVMQTFIDIVSEIPPLSVSSDCDWLF